MSTAESDKDISEPPKESLATPIFKWIASLSGLFTVMATLFGMYYHQGTLYGYGIPSMFFQISLQDSLALSHEAFLFLVSQNISALFTNYHPLLEQSILSAIGVSLLAVSLLWIHNRGKKSSVPASQPWIKRHKTIPWTIAASTGPIFGLFVYFAPRVLIAVGAIVAFLPVLGYYVGQANSKEFIKKSACEFEKPISEKNRCSRILRSDPKDPKNSEEQVIQGDILASNDRWIAVLQGTNVRILPSSPVEIIVPVPTEKK